MGNNHFNRRNHVANDYHEDIYVQVVSDTVSQSVRDKVKINIKNMTVGRRHNRQLGTITVGTLYVLRHAPSGGEFLV